MTSSMETPNTSNTPATLRRRHRPEVLAPAGNLRGLKTAVDYGADAVYCGGKAFGMRSAPKNLSLEDFEEGSRYAHEHGARVYVTLNVLPRNNEVESIREYIGQLGDTGIDALIVTDIGVMMTAHAVAPNLELHVSTQAGVTNYGAANALYELGARRVVLAREMDLQAVRDIRARIPEDMDVECFVHGAMCMAFSGRCLFSNYLTGRDGNHGECAQSCRWKYSIVEEKRPGEYYPIEQTEEGAYLFNSQDMCMMEHIDDLIDSGATSLKIEGRSKSAYYIAAMTNAYKTAVNEYMIQRGFEDRDGNVLKPFRDRVIRPSDPDFPAFAEVAAREPDRIMAHADEAFSGVPGERPTAAPEPSDVSSVPSSVPSSTSLPASPSASTASSADPDDLSYHARSTRRKSNTAAEILPDGWLHAPVRPAPPVTLPDWLLDEPNKVAHRDYSTGFYYPERKVTQNTNRSAYFRAWMVVGEVLGWSAEEGGRVTIMSRNKIEPGQHVEFLLPGEPPLEYDLPADGLRDADGNWVAAINNPAHVFSFPCPHRVPVNAAIRSRTKRPTLKAE
ncbi:peptidase U32 family protein [Bifidobacterium vespertilionis]|uniref:U32 family peptidase n=1 Tax=Bifidobacterium vespertilionis TaxID=2562524 RepID=A0A5J5E181_9BIFI|nr:U32 family peptidase [Bifidobacterium vespertilionis]KAA8822855.1 U32 family peptidase [Bifidobacterium vespertilionis]